MAFLAMEQCPLEAWVRQPHHGWGIAAICKRPKSSPTSSNDFILQESQVVSLISIISLHSSVASEIALASRNLVYDFVSAKLELLNISFLDEIVDSQYWVMRGC